MRKALISLLTLGFQTLYGQIDSTVTGEIIDTEIIIEKNQKIKLPLAEKISTRVIVRSFELEPLNFTYEFLEPEFDWPAYKTDVRFVEIDEVYPISQYQNYIKGGYGNYRSPLIETGVYKKLKNVKLTSKIFHEKFGKGPIEEENSSSSISSFDFSANYTGKAFELNPRLTFSRSGYRFYGNTNRINTGFNTETLPKVANGFFQFEILAKGEGKGLKYYVKPLISSNNQSFVNGRKINKESGFEATAGLSLKIDKRNLAGFDIEGHSSTYKGGIDYIRSLFIIKPWASHSRENFKIKGGFSLASGKTGTSSPQSDFYPFINSELKLTQKWSIYGAFGGGVDWNDLKTLFKENQFLDDSLNIQNSELTSSIEGGLKGIPVNGLLVKAGIRLDNYKRMPFYIPSVTDSSRFILTYDDGTVNIFTFYGDVTFSPTTNTLTGSTIEVYGYRVKSLEKAWYQPSYALSIYFSQNIKDKILINIELIGQGGITSPINPDPEYINLSPFLDLNISANYRLADRFSVFFELNNLLDKKYEKFIGYPVRGISLKVGGNYRF